MTGIPPAVLLEEDPDMFEALEAAAVRRETRWTTGNELSATTAELLHALYLLTARAGGAKNVGKAMRIPRPGDTPITPRTISPRDFAVEARSERG